MKPAEEIRYQILAIQREGNRLLAMQLSNAGITPSQAEVISLLAQFGTLSLKELGAMLVCETGDSPSRLVSRMVSSGFVERVRDSSDGRALVLSLSSKGMEVFNSVVKPADEAMHGILDSIFNPAELESLRLQLAHLSLVLDADTALKARIANSKD